MVTLCRSQDAFGPGNHRPDLVTGIAAMIVALVSLTGIWMAKSQINRARLSRMILVKLAVRAAAGIGWS